LPEPARTWVERHAHIQDLTVEAAREGDLTKAFMALALDPLVARLTMAQIGEMGRRLLTANERYLPQFEGQLRENVTRHLPPPEAKAGGH
jgi:alpha-galactosidase/6-phospho-beta-glucosidase family protein